MTDSNRSDPTDEFEQEPPLPDLTEVFESPGGLDLKADITLATPGIRNGACVVFVHGGGWSSGERQAFRWHAYRVSLLGYLAVTIDYRLMPAAPFPAALEDCQSAIAWIRRQAGRFGVDPARIGAVGSSAGGHLAACLGVLDDSVGGISTRVNCVVDIHGIHDFPALRDETGAIKMAWEAFLGGPYKDKEPDWTRASPALHVDGESAPMLVVHDPSDETVPYEQSRLLVDALVVAGRPVQFVPSPGSGHGFFYNPSDSWTRKVWPVAIDWLAQQLLGANRQQNRLTQP